MAGRWLLSSSLSVALAFAVAAVLGATACGRSREASSGARDGAAGEEAAQANAWNPSAGPFEGTLRVQLSIASQEAQTIEIDIKKHRARWDVDAFGPDVSGYRVYDADARKVYMVSPPLKQTAVVDLPAEAVDGGDSEWKLTGNGAGSVEGVPCERERAQRGDVTYEVCVARGILPVPLQYASGAALVAAPFLDDVLRAGSFPLAALAQGRAPAGVGHEGKLGMFRVMAITPHAVDDERFALPSYPVVQGGKATPVGPPLRH